MRDLTAVAGGGLLHRRAFLGGALAIPGGLVLGSAALAGPLVDPVWSHRPGALPRGYGMPSPAEGHVARIPFTPFPGIAPGAAASFSPLSRLRGRITPNGLHFERHHSGVPAIDPGKHVLAIHGRVKRPLSFRVEDLLRYPTVTRQLFLECAGNSLLQAAPEPSEKPCAVIHGLVSCSEWTGVPLSVLLDEVGPTEEAHWAIAEGADAARMNRSVPMEKLFDDALIALYQNGERLRPEQGYPLRLLLPGWEGNTSVKWLRRLELAPGPVHSREETARYSDRLADGKALQFTFEMGVKSVITHPSAGLDLSGSGLYELSGICWSGAGRVRRVEVSADGGASWADAELEAPVLSRCLARFRIPWHWQGGPALLLSRATDETGATQPSRDVWLERYAPAQIYHCNAIQAWQVEPSGRVRAAFT